MAATSPAAGSAALVTLGERVRARRRELGLTQEALAYAVALHWTFIGQVERGRRNLSVLNLLKLAGGLHVDPAELVRGLRAAALDG